MVLQFSNSCEEGGKEKKKSKWLPTHIWHAKRFHMTEQFGWRLPLSPTQKCMRHAYHSVARNCVAVDTSYLSVFEISSDTTLLLTESLRSILPPSLDLSLLLSLSPLDTTLYHPDSYPHGAVGPVTLLPLSPSSLWLVVHPAMRSELSPLVARLAGGVSCQELTSEIGSIQLLGPSSLHLLLAALPPDLSTCPSPEDAGHWYDGFNHRSPLLSSFLQDLSRTPLSHLPPESILGYTALDPRLSLPQKRVPLHTSPPERNELTELLLQLQSELEQDTPVSGGVEVIPDTPHLPSPRVQEVASVYLPNRHLFSTSQLSNAQHRRMSVEGRHSDHSINTHRRRESQELPFPTDRVPLLLVTTPGCHGSVGSTGAFGAGVLLFLPRDWVLTSWVALTYRGVKPVGMRELERVSLERQVPCFPRDHIDTYSYVLDSFEKRRSLEKEFFSRPPDKRLNYGKLGVSTPFHCPWGSLVKSECQLMDTETTISHPISESESTSTLEPALAGVRLRYCVVRERRAVLSLQSALFRTHMPYKYIPKPYRLRYPCKRLPPLPDPLPLQHISLQFPNSLVLASVHMLGRGCVESRSALFLPTHRDLQAIAALYKNDSEIGDASSFSIDNTSSLGVTTLSAGRQVVCGVSVESRELKAATNVLKRHIKEVREISSQSTPELSPSSCLYKPSDTLLSEMGLSRVPEDSRECCGYITSGGYSFCRGYSAGVGCILTSSLLKLIEAQEKVRLPPLLLVRNPSALQLYPALFTLLDSA